MIKFEWDEFKRWRNIDSRGLDFMDLEYLDWTQTRTRRDDRKDYPETRFVTTGFLKERLVVCVWCRRGENVRVISFRKANEKEQRKFEAS